MPTKCKAEQKAFDDAVQAVADTEIAYIIATQELIAAVWESGAKDIEFVKEADEFIHTGHPAQGLIALMKSVADDHASEARLKAKQLARDHAAAKRAKAHSDYLAAQKALQKCLKQSGKHWSGFIRNEPLAKQKKEGNTGTFYSSSESSSMSEYEIIGPAPGSDPTLYFVKWTGSVYGEEKNWGKPKKDFVIYSSSITKSGFDTGLVTANIDYDDSSGISFSFSVPGILAGKVHVTTTSDRPGQNFEKSSMPLTLIQPDFVDGQKLEHDKIKRDSVEKHKADDFGPAYAIIRVCELHFK